MVFSFERMASSHRNAVVDIFNYYVVNSFAAYFEKPVPPAFFDRLLQAADGYPSLVAVTESGQVVGFGLLRPFHPASSVRRTAEVSYFIAPGFTKQGIGSAMLTELTEQAAAIGIDSLVANVSSENPSSISFHRKNGFQECGRFSRAGTKNHQDFDMVWMQKLL